MTKDLPSEFQRMYSWAALSPNILARQIDVRNSTIMQQFYLLVGLVHKVLLCWGFAETASSRRGRRVGWPRDLLEPRVPNSAHGWTFVRNFGRDHYTAFDIGDNRCSR